MFLFDMKRKLLTHYLISTCFRRFDTHEIPSLINSVVSPNLTILDKIKSTLIYIFFIFILYLIFQLPITYIISDFNPNGNTSTVLTKITSTTYLSLISELILD